MRCFTDEDGNEECYSSRQVQETEALGWFLAVAALFMLWVAGTYIQIGTQEEWTVLTSKPIDFWAVRDFLNTALYDVAFAVVLFVFGMGFSLQIFGAFRGPGSTPGPVMRDMSGGGTTIPRGETPGEVGEGAIPRCSVGWDGAT